MNKRIAKKKYKQALQTMETARKDGIEYSAVAEPPNLLE